MTISAVNTILSDLSFILGYYAITNVGIFYRKLKCGKIHRHDMNLMFPKPLTNQKIARRRLTKSGGN